MHCNAIAAFHEWIGRGAPMLTVGHDHGQLHILSCICCPSNVQYFVIGGQHDILMAQMSRGAI
jgi:hypothetical protein